RGYSQSEEQGLQLTGSVGTFQLTFTNPNGVSSQTGLLPFTISADALRDALNTLPSISDVGGSVSVDKSGSLYLIRFGGSLRGQNLDMMTVTTSGPSATVTGRNDGYFREPLSVLAGDNLWHGPVTLAGLPVAEQQLMKVVGSPGDTFTLT